MKRKNGYKVTNYFKNIWQKAQNLIRYFRNKLSIKMNAIEAINKIKNLLGIKLAEEEVKEEVNETPTETETTETVEVKPEDTVEDRVAKLEQRMDDLTGKFDEIYKIVVEVVDEANKSNEQVKEEIREEVIEELAKANPTAEPIHVQQSAHKQAEVSPKCAMLMELRENRKMNK